MHNGISALSKKNSWNILLQADEEAALGKQILWWKYE